MASIRGAAVLGDQDAVRANMTAMHEDFRKSIKLADPARRVDRETARALLRSMPGVLTSVWVDHENLLVMVADAGLRSQALIDEVCIALEPLGDTLGVVVNVQNSAATTGDELEILSRNCQLAPGDRAMMQRPRQLDVISPELRLQQRQDQARADMDHARRARQRDETARIIESIPEM